MKTNYKIIGTFLIATLSFAACNQPQPIPPQPTPQPPVIQAPTTEPAATDAITQLLSQKYNKPVSDITLNISAQDDTHVRGTVVFAPGGAENTGLFLAAKVSNQWKIAYEGNGAAPCTEIAKYGFSAGMLKGICDPQPTAQGPTAVMTVKVFFNNPKIDPKWATQCNNVLAVEREIPKTDSVALAAVTELLNGPTNSEKDKGYMTNINSGVKIQKLTIENSIAKIDFNEQLEYQVGGSCRTSAIIAQIKQTLEQFPTIKDVIISINGKTEAILQP